MRTLYRCGIGLFLVVLVSGCSVLGFDDSDRDSSSSSSNGSGCQWNRSSCLYEGAYEPGERDYAEQEAKRLNQAALQRLRRSSVR